MAITKHTNTQPTVTAMKIVKIDGEMGVQMFQYALYLKLRSTDADTALDAPRQWIAQQFAITNCAIATSKQIDDLKGSKMSQIKGLLGLNKAESKVITDTFGEFSREALNATEGYYSGTWASHRYFESVAQEVAEAFIAAPDSLGNANEIIDQITNCETETVAVHIHKPTSPQNTCTTDYYNWAIANIRTYIPDAKFFVFTDEPQLVKDRLLLPEGSVFVSTKQLSEFQLLQTMLRASHNIGANTLTSWWAAWLNPNPDKITIVPKKWSNNGTPKDLIPLFWTAIPTT